MYRVCIAENKPATKSFVVFKAKSDKKIASTAIIFSTEDFLKDDQSFFKLKLQKTVKIQSLKIKQGAKGMFYQDGKLQYEVRVDNPNPPAACTK